MQQEDYNCSQNFKMCVDNLDLIHSQVPTVYINEIQ
jgi:hypothetical protein